MFKLQVTAVALPNLSTAAAQTQLDKISQTLSDCGDTLTDLYNNAPAGSDTSNLDKIRNGLLQIEMENSTLLTKLMQGISGDLGVRSDSCAKFGGGRSSPD